MSRLLLMYICVASLSLIAVQQQQPDSKAPVSVEVIDGSKEPNRIPDEVARLLLFQILADRVGGPSFDARAEHLKAGEFLESEIREVMGTANRTVLQIAEMEEEVAENARSMSMDEQTQVLRTRRDSIIRAAIARLDRRLGPEGNQRWHSFINNTVKRGIRTPAEQ